MTTSLCACANCGAVAIEADLNEIIDAWERGDDGVSADETSPGECPACGSLTEPCDSQYDRHFAEFGRFAGELLADKVGKIFATLEIVGLDKVDWRKSKDVRVLISLYERSSRSVSLARRGEIESLWCSSPGPIGAALADARKFALVNRIGLTR